MIAVTFILPDGSRRTVGAGSEENLMQLATFNGVPGIEGACGGFCSCASCHVYVESSHALPPPSAAEKQMLGGTAAKRTRHSRLACQIRIDAAIAGLVVRIPAAQ